MKERPSPQGVAELATGVVRGDRRMLARALRYVDDAPEIGRRLVCSLPDPASGPCSHVIGITGNPGAGKSTVADALVAHYRAEGRSVGVLAVDPSSPFSGGAILGDRIRMGRHAGDDGVFIRSLATRGSLGGLSRATFDSVRLLEAAGFDVIVVETVGVGQDEVDIARLAQTTVVIMVPGLGDDVQAIKAGLLEIADIFLVNKADRDGAAEVERALRQMLAMAPHRQQWDIPILRSVALRAEGIADLAVAVAQHGAYLTGPEGQKRAGQRAHELFHRLLDAALIEQGRRRLGQRLHEAGDRVARGLADPHAEVLHLLEGHGRPGAGLDDQGRTPQ